MPRAHRNLHSLKAGSTAKPWSFYRASGDRVTGADFLILENVTPKHPSGKKAEHCLAGTGNRSVFAWLNCERLTAWCDSIAGHTAACALPKDSTYARLRLNPTQAGGDQFFHAQGQKYTGSARVYLCPDGRAYTSTESLK